VEITALRRQTHVVKKKKQKPFRHAKTRVCYASTPMYIKKPLAMEWKGDVFPRFPARCDLMHLKARSSS
jgi:hypothetical protein